MKAGFYKCKPSDAPTYYTATLKIAIWQVLYDVRAGGKWKVQEAVMMLLAVIFKHTHTGTVERCNLGCFDRISCYMLMKHEHHNMDNCEQTETAFSHYSTLFGRLKSNLLYHQWHAISNSHKKGDQTSTESYNPHDDYCTFYQHLSLLSLPGLFDVKYTSLQSTQRTLLLRFLLLEE